jgi:hypothetical protein
VLHILKNKKQAYEVMLLSVLRTTLLHGVSLWMRVLIEKLIVTHFIKKFPSFMELEGS